MVEFSQEIFDAICNRLSSGESLRAICRDSDMPDARDVNRWLYRMPEIVPQYARAREAQADAIFDECLDIADDRALDIGEDGTVDHEAIARARLRIDTRKWMAGKLRPKVYGEKMDLTSSDGTMTPVTRIERVIVQVERGEKA